MKKIIMSLAVLASLAMSTTASAVGTLTLDAVIGGGVQNNLVISLSGTPLVNTDLSGTIEISNATGDGSEITGFEIGGGLINTTDTFGLISLTSVTSTPTDTNPGINAVTAGDFNAEEIGLSIDGGTADIPAFSLSFDFSTDPVAGPGSGTGTLVTNSVTPTLVGTDYDVTISIPIALVLEVTTGVNAGVDGFIVASGTISTTTIPEPTSGLFLASLAAGAGAVVRRRRK